jgi:glycosyltransferase involved in cell wall biosynthesis
LVAQHWTLRRLLRSYPVDVVFAPGNFGSLTLPRGTGSVVTIHDLQHVALPEYFSRATRSARTLLFAASIRRSHRVICVSHFTRRGVAHRFRVAHEKLVVIHEGSPPVRSGTLEPAPQRPAAPYVIYPAMAAPHKNHLVLLEALALLKKRDNDPVALALTGKATEHTEWIEAQAERLGVRTCVEFFGYLPPAHLANLMEHASALVYPSTFEGFGLPLLEAMRAGVPVIASTSGAIPEVAGDAAWLIDAHAADEWAEAIARITTDDECRGRLIARGRRRADEFSWDACAEQTISVLHEAAAVAKSGN